MCVQVTIHNSFSHFNRAERAECSFALPPQINQGGNPRETWPSEKLSPDSSGQVSTVWTPALMHNIDSFQTLAGNVKECCGGNSNCLSVLHIIVRFVSLRK